MTRFGEFLSLWLKVESLRQFLFGQFSAWQNLRPTWANYYAIWQIFIVVNGQILVNIIYPSGHTAAWSQNQFWQQQNYKKQFQTILKVQRIALLSISYFFPIKNTFFNFRENDEISSMFDTRCLKKFQKIFPFLNKIGLLTLQTV